MKLLKALGRGLAALIRAAIIVLCAFGLFVTGLVVSKSIEHVEQTSDKARALDICEKVKSITDVQARQIKCVYSPSKAINAHASNNNGLEIVIYQGMLDFVESDDELAVVIGHELGHHMLGHLAMSKYHGIPHYGYKGSPFLTSQYREAMADLLGIQLTTMAGYNPCKGADLWKRLVKLYGHSYHGSGTHPHKLARIYNYGLFCER